VIVLAEKNDHKTLIDEENNARSVNPGLPGFQPIPDIQFSLADPNLPVLVDLEIQLEGDSLIQLVSTVIIYISLFVENFANRYYI
jgi:hypothetical protein